MPGTGKTVLIEGQSITYSRICFFIIETLCLNVVNTWNEMVFEM